MGWSSTIGFKLGETRFSQINNQTGRIREVIQVLSSSASDTEEDVRSTLPAYGAVGQTITFSLGISRHPDNAGYILNSVSNFSLADGSATVWEADVEYLQTQAFIIGIEFARPDQQVTNPDSDPSLQTLITSPLNRPPIWKSTPRVVVKKTRTKPDGSLILLPNGLPLPNDGISEEEVHQIHNFSWNVAYSSFNDSDFSQFLGKVSSNDIFGKTGSGTKKQWKCISYAPEEMWETLHNTTTRVHYVRVSMSWEFNPSGWENKIVPMSNYQLKGGKILPIVIGPNKTFVKTGWPLKNDGEAVAESEVIAGTTTNYGTISTGRPETIAMASFISLHGLVVP